MKERAQGKSENEGASARPSSQGNDSGATDSTPLAISLATLQRTLALPETVCRNRRRSSRSGRKEVSIQQVVRHEYRLEERSEGGMKEYMLKDREAG